MIEGVAAVGEVKSVLTTVELERAIKAGAKYKTLRPTFADDDKIFGAANRELALATGGVPPFFVLAFERVAATKTILETLRSAEKVPLPDGKGYPDGRGNDPQPPVDCVCILGEGVFLNMRTGKELPIRFVTAEGEAVQGWEWMATPAPLALTLTWLHAEMPRVVRSASISLPYFAPKPEHIQYMQMHAKAEKG